jgi:ACR3 family arsenite transporter
VVPPLFLYLFLGSDLGSIVAVGPFLRAFAFLIVIPLALAWATQAWAARGPPARTSPMRRPPRWCC